MSTPPGCRMTEGRHSGGNQEGNHPMTAWLARAIQRLTGLTGDWRVPLCTCREPWCPIHGNTH